MNTFKSLSTTCVCVCTCMWCMLSMPVCVEIKDQCWISSFIILIILILLLFFYLRQVGLLIEPGTVSGRLVGQQAPGSFCFCASKADYRCPLTCQAPILVVRSSTQVSVFAWQELYPVSYLPSPQLTS